MEFQHRHSEYPHPTFPTRHPDYSRLPILDSSPFPPPTPFPGVPPRPLNVPNLRHSPSLPLTPSTSPVPETIKTSVGRHISYPIRTSSSGALRRTQTVGTGSGRSTTRRRESIANTFSDPPPPTTPVEQGKPGRMSWLQRKDGKKKEKLRSVTDPARSSERASNPPSPPKRAISSSGMGMGVRVKNRIGSFSLGSTDRVNEDEETQDNDLRAKAKGWKKRMFSREKKEVAPLRIQGPAHIQITKPKSPTPSTATEASSDSDRTVVNDRKEKENICELDIPSKLTVATAGSKEQSASPPRVDAEGRVEPWQVDGGASQAYPETPRRQSIEKTREDLGPTAQLQGRLQNLLKPERYVQPWKPPVLNLELKAVADVAKIPVTVEGSQEVWVAVTLNGVVGGDADVAASNASQLGLDVAVLMDTSSYTSPAAFEDMRRQARQLVEGMDTTKDRITVMTFSCPSPERRRPSSLLSSPGNVKMLSSSGCVAKKKLIGDIAALEPGIQADPTGRDVHAALAEALKTLHAMPLDASRFGTRRAGHLFLITAQLGVGELSGDFGDVQVHVLGVGSLFKPSSDMGGNGYCTAVAAPLEIGNGLRRIVADGLEIEVKKPTSLDQGTNMKELLNLLRMGVDIGKISAGSVFLTPGEGCRIRSVLGPLTFSRLLPGDHRTVMVKVAVGDLEHWPPEPITHIDYDDGRSTANHRFDFDELERHLEATLGELKTCILTAEVVYQHSLLPATTPRISVDVHVNRFVHDNVWGSSRARTIASPCSDENLSLRAEVHELLIQNHAAQAHITPSELRDFSDELDLNEEVVRELGYREWLKERYSIVEDIYTSPSMREFENFERAEEEEVLLMTPPPLDLTLAARSLRGRSPDEARRLWMKLGGFDEEEDGHEAVNGGVEDERPGVMGRRSTGQDTVITMRNVKETDFSPWVV